MLSRSNRLPRALFDEVFKRGKRVTAPFATLQFLASSALEARFSAVVSKKVAKTAVVRNRLHRRSYAALASLLPKIKPGFSGAFYLQKPAALASAKETATQIESLLRKAGLMR